MPRKDISSPGVAEVLVGSAARSTSGDTGPLAGWGSARVIRAQLHVTASGGTAPVLDVEVQDSVDDGQNWNTLAAFPQMLGPGREVINVVEPFADMLRIRWTVGGQRPSITFSVSCYSE
jgi:hypothetical protein